MLSMMHVQVYVYNLCAALCLTLCGMQTKFVFGYLGIWLLLLYNRWNCEHNVRMISFRSLLCMAWWLSIRCINPMNNGSFATPSVASNFLQSKAHTLFFALPIKLQLKKCSSRFFFGMVSLDFISIWWSCLKHIQRTIIFIINFLVLLFWCLGCVLDMIIWRSFISKKNHAKECKYSAYKQILDWTKHFILI